MVRPVHLVGSVPLSDAEAVLTTCCSVLGDRLARVPDGETGIRTNWIQWQRSILGSHPGIELIGEGKNADQTMPQFSIRDGFSESFTFSDLGYRSSALESFRVFKTLKEDGKIGRQRFQVSLPTPLAAIACYVEQSSQERLFSPYRDRLIAEAEAIINSVPHDELAIQWDVAIEFAVLEGLFPVWFEDPLTVISTQLSELADLVPDTVEAGFHFCYGDAGNKHFKEPQDMRLMVDLANRVVRQTKREIDWIHMPVPIDRTDSEYFEPLRELTRSNLNSLFLGLIHEQDGAEGARKRMAAADEYLADYGVATECGMGRRKPEIINHLLALHTLF